MVPPTQQLNLDITAISGICGSISIACWVVVFSPQIIEQFRRGSADGLSLQFIIVWLLGDVFNILGAMLQGVLPTMLILAVYYTLADIVLLLQCFYYRGFTWYDEVIPPPKPAAAQASIGEANERTGLLSQPANPTYNPFSEHSERERRPSFFSESSVHLSPVVPLVETRKLNAEAPAIKDQKPTTLLQATLFNLFTILLVSAAGVFGWYISERSASSSRAEKPAKGEEHLTFSLWGQIFGYICAVLYLGSRIPQLILNFRRKSTSGVSVLFFLFACIGNLTYVLSIFAYEPPCVGKKHGCKNGVAAREYWRYIAVNASWLAGSLGTLCLDLGIFAQFFHYRERDAGEDDSAIDDDESQVGNGRDAERPLLDRDNSGL